MAGIKGKDTSPEVLIRKGLHARGFRFRLHAKELPGRPDLIFPRYKVVILVHGCFWHGHTCRYFKVPKTRPEFWLDKIGKNQARDALQIGLLRKAEWRVLVIWECAVRLMVKEKTSTLIDEISDWIKVGGEYAEFDELVRKLS
ncbi:very short patch repair endonuclease [Pseudomonas sp. SORT22]|uniref:very short patch repair endonuclease n=1 Tax=Pseudomonas sp. SORT22 TaxID=2813842 RepID=UPI00201B6397|nr:very short patch repair endonuclease [Pseudomonas sp. SORT22]